eukprot:3050133-Alexandrium_andersonii.AAC.1
MAARGPRSSRLASPLAPWERWGTDAELAVDANRILQRAERAVVDLGRVGPHLATPRELAEDLGLPPEGTPAAAQRYCLDQQKR